MPKKVKKMWTCLQHAVWERQRGVLVGVCGGVSVPRLMFNFFFYSDTFRLC